MWNGNQYNYKFIKARCVHSVCNSSQLHTRGVCVCAISYYKQAPFCFVFVLAKRFSQKIYVHIYIFYFCTHFCVCVALYYCSVRVFYIHHSDARTVFNSMIYIVLRVCCQLLAPHFCAASSSSNKPSRSTSSFVNFASLFLFLTSSSFGLSSRISASL